MQKGSQNTARFGIFRTTEYTIPKSQTKYGSCLTVAQNAKTNQSINIYWNVQTLPIDLWEFCAGSDRVRDRAKSPVEYRILLFGTASSPRCANYGLKGIAQDHKEAFRTKAANFVKHDFYVDTDEHAISLVEKTKQVFAKGSLHLHKFVSNSKNVIAEIPPEDRSSQLKNLHLRSDLCHWKEH